MIYFCWFWTFQKHFSEENLVDIFGDLSRICGITGKTIFYLMIFFLSSFAEIMINVVTVSQDKSGTLNLVKIVNVKMDKGWKSREGSRRFKDFLLWKDLISLSFIDFFKSFWKFSSFLKIFKSFRKFSSFFYFFKYFWKFSREGPVLSPLTYRVSACT